MVDLLPVVQSLAVFDVHCSQNIVKDGMKAYIPKTKFGRYQFELRLAIIPKQRSPIVRADRKVEEAINRTARIFHVDDDLARRILT
jgi:hypothetical protein